MVQIAMTIAGSDNSGGAGIQADIKTFQELGVFGTSALTAVTAQNTQGVHAIQSIDPEIIAAQIEAIFTDFPVHAVKTGMLFSSEIIQVVAEQLKNKEIPLVIDPVMIAKGGASLLREEAIEALKKELLPIATVVTPNIPEAEVLTGLQIQNNADIEKAAKHILALGAKSVVIKGGHRVDVPDAEDLFMSAAGEKFYVRTPWIDTKDTHGTGCTYAAALTAFLAEGKKQADAVISAKNFIHAAIENGLDIGSGHGPTNHWAYKQRMTVEKHKKGVVIDG
ncbi:bifunctional hydroxymethylpyrimidine kinase/phosphomethylpyrimidine kinase [Sporosarcina ureilytica]|uniref:Hydroxymethylpyrimidine/phosphomethylpyrimidine kinase n=1 Tax=Sporosarcina ureilytica TaxID=298596 RepID=A0A1D8JCP3_9BACL|nr:bifunctional hydroxymethylpyrimidine kinase/phosphomethylpyrimidine kinase [Sporosarcina ureilytica]AOV06472.1 bifunctional hydroxymethylpyrimidine kinase/phosphomethylpyrimidine kinase [Sporosarcina ureilytica]